MPTGAGIVAGVEELEEVRSYRCSLVDAVYAREKLFAGGEPADIAVCSGTSLEPLTFSTWNKS